jgi:hypothetical protein
MPGLRVSPSVAITGVPGLAVLSVLVVAGLLAGGVIGGPGYRVDGPAPGTLTVGGVHLTLDAQVPVVSVTPVPGDARRVAVDAGQAAAETAACGAYTAVRITRQDDRRIRIAAYSYRVADGAAPDAACAEPGFTGHATVDLGSPLDGRRVVEQGTDRVLVLAR